MPRHEFAPLDVERLLVACHRRCCVCHRYCGVKIEIDHIETAVAPGAGDIANAIALCFDCHAEVHQYNVNHPKGRRFQPSELRAHRDQWLELCAGRPEMFVHAQPAPEAGSLERLLCELEFNHILTGHPASRFETVQFRRAIADGTFVWLAEGPKRDIHVAYAAMAHAQAVGEGYAGRSQTESVPRGPLDHARATIETAMKTLRSVLFEERA